MLCPHDRRQRIGTVRTADAAAIEAAIAGAQRRARLGPARRAGARADPGQRRRPLRARPRAADGGDRARGRQDAGERAGRRARGGRLPALLRGEARRLFAGPVVAHGADGREQYADAAGARAVRLHLARGISRSRSSPGQVAAALAAGNPVLAKPAEQTPIVAFLAVQLLHEAGVPPQACCSCCRAPARSARPWSRTRAWRASPSPAPTRPAGRSSSALADAARRHRALHRRDRRHQRHDRRLRARCPSR